MIAQELASSRPDLVAGLVLFNTSHRIGTPESHTDRISMLDKCGVEPLADGALERWLSPKSRRDDPDLVSGYRMMLVHTPLTGYRAVCAAIRDADLTRVADRLDSLALCFAGGDDLATPPDIAESTAALIPGADYICYDEVDHLPCIEAPARLAKDILRFVKTCP